MLILISMLRRLKTNGLQVLSSALHSCALEADRKTIRASSQVGAYHSEGRSKSFAAVVEELAESYYIDRSPKTSDRNLNKYRPFKGYGQGSRRSRTYNRATESGKNKIPWDVCIVCSKKCRYSSRNRNAGRYATRKIAKAYLAGDVPDYESDGESETENEEDDEEIQAYANFARTTAAMGLSARNSDYVLLPST